MPESERSYEDLQTRLNALEARVHALEEQAGLESTPLRPTVDEASARDAAPAPDASTLLGAAGRAFLVLGGAFLIRALAQGGTLSNPVGVALGAAYVVLWIVLSDRAARRGDRLTAVAFGFCATLVGAPLVWEASSRFAVVSPPVGAGAVVLLVAALLGLATLHRLRLLAWIAVAAGVATPLALLSSTHDLIAASAALVVCGLAAAVAAIVGDAAAYPRWPAAVLADLLVFFGVHLAARAGGPPANYETLGARSMLLVALLLSLAYLGAFTWAALVRRRDSGAFEIVQGSVATGLGLLAITRLGPPSGLPSGALGAVLVAVGLAVFAASFTLLDRAPELRRSFLFCAWQAWILVLFGSWPLLATAPRAVAWALLAILSAVLAIRFDRWTLALQAALASLAAAAVAGAPGALVDALVAGAPAEGRALALPFLFSVAAAAIVHRLLRRYSESPSALRRVAAWLPAVAWIVGAAGVLAAGLTVVLGAGAEPPRLALARSLALSATAVVVGLVARARVFGELPGFALAMLVVTALQLVVETAPSGDALIVFLGFGAFGLALLLAARLRRRPA